MSPGPDDWWHSLPYERRERIHRWLDSPARKRPAEPDPDQMTIDEDPED